MMFSSARHQKGAETMKKEKFQKPQVICKTQSPVFLRLEEIKGRKKINPSFM